MKAEADNITFRPVACGDLELLATWMDKPHWRRWWGEPEGELDDIRNMIEGRDTSRPFLFLVDGREAGYIQYWFVGHHQNKSWIAGHPWLADLPEETIGIDLSIGEEKDLARGLGSMALHKFATHLYGFGYTTIIIDPDPGNKRAIRAYEKAGFHTVEHLAGKYDDVLIMQFQLNKNELN